MCLMAMPQRYYDFLSLIYILYILLDERKHMMKYIHDDKTEFNMVGCRPIFWKSLLDQSFQDKML